MKKIFVTRKIPDNGLAMLRDAGLVLTVSEKPRPLTKRELIKALRTENYNGVMSLLTDTIDAEVMDAAPTVKIFANFAVGYNNIALPEARKRGVTITNTPGASTESVSEFTLALILNIARRVNEGDRFVRAGKFKGWGPPMFGRDIKGMTLGIVGSGRIGAEVAKKALRGFEMQVVYYDVVRNEALEKEYGARFVPTVEELLRMADVVSLHVPLLDSTRHLMNAERLRFMKKTAYLVNTSRGPVIDENALVDALRDGVIAGAALDVFEFEPKLTKGLAKLENVVLTPHIAAGTEIARQEMARLAAGNLVAFFGGKTPPNVVE